MIFFSHRPDIPDRPDFPDFPDFQIFRNFQIFRISSGWLSLALYGRGSGERVFKKAILLQSGKQSLC